MNLSGKSLIGFRDGSTTTQTFQAVAPATGETLEPSFYSASNAEIERAAQLASAAFTRYGQTSGRERATFLRLIASKIEALTEVLVDRAGKETALPAARLQGEVGRTCGQLRLFAKVVEDGSWSMPRIDRADPDRKPAPKPDVRSMLRPLGPVVVFGASNFPLAFSVAGGDTASALAAGNPVIVKAHPAHPGTSELVGQAIRESVKECGFPEGVFSLLFDSGTEVGTKLILHPLVKAGGFTGSQGAGRALFQLAVNRPEPIPFYAEMASTNPLFILPGALAARGEKIAADLYSSFTLGAGQFCTKPGLVFLQQNQDAEKLVAALEEKVAAATPFTLLTPGIANSFAREVSKRGSHAQLKLAAAPSSGRAIPTLAHAALFVTDVSAYLENPAFEAEHFGPSTLVVRCSEKEQLLASARKLSGHLTATIHGTPQDLEEYAELLRILETKVGRIVFNGFPTGVEVNHAMVHGGPYPATSDSRTTSVGSLAILRFARPVCYQDFPDAALPPELQNANPLAVWRLLDGEPTNQPAC